MTGEVPEDRCGFVLKPVDISFAYATRIDIDSLNEWYERSKAVCCWRKPWKQSKSGRCIWHANVEQKPASKLADARSNESERLDGAVFRGAGLKDIVNFADCTLLGVDFTDTNLEGNDLTGTLLGLAALTDASLREADLTNADLTGADLTEANLHRADLSGVKLYRSSLRSARVQDADLTVADIRGAELNGVDLRETNLRNADLTDSNLRDASLNGADLLHADFTNANLTEADLTDADLTGADLTAATLQKADLQDANLVRAKLRDTDLPDADLTDADLQDAILRDTDLTYADLTDANLRNANLNNTDFSDANLTRATINYTELDEIEFNAGTIFRGRSQWERPTFSDRLLSDPWFIIPFNIQMAPFHFILYPVFVLSIGPVIRPSHLKMAELQYRVTQSLLREDNRRKESPELDIREKDARRKRLLAERKPLHWFTLAGSRWTTLYGESPWRVVATSLLVIVAGVVLYPLAGLDVPSWFDRLYFSVATFTPLMQAEGLASPSTMATKAVAMTQAMLGVALTALLVAVLDRRITR